MVYFQPEVVVVAGEFNHVVDVVVEAAKRLPTQLGFDVGEVKLEVFPSKGDHPGLQKPASSSKT